MLHPDGTTTCPPGRQTRSRISLRLSLLLLVTVCVLPAAIVATGLGVANYRLQRHEINSKTTLLARKIAAEVDRELSRIESGLRVLATSSDLLDGDLAAFHQRARDALKSQIAYNYVLTDREGRQLMNTLVPFGTPLPASGNPSQLQQVFASGAPVLTDLFIGPVTKQFAIAVGVPVYRSDTIIYSLNIGLMPDRVAEILNRNTLPEGWVARVVDGAGSIVAHTQEQLVGEKAIESLRTILAQQEDGSLEGVGRDGEPTVTSFCKSSLWNWHVAISAPKSVLDADLYRLIIWVVAGTVLAITLGAWLAMRLAGRVMSSVRELNDAALALCEGLPVELPRIQIKEAEAVGTAIIRAAEIMEQVRHRAYHDMLTGLANRVLFDELLRHQFMLANRSNGQLAILAVDLDGFKAVNDQQGHARGDDVLRLVAKRINHTIRSSDTAARIGGDEFLIMLCDDDQAGALQIAERLVAALSAPYPGITSPVSASIGVAVYPQSGNTIEDLIERADQALYRAKHAGKKRVVID